MEEEMKDQCLTEISCILGKYFDDKNLNTSDIFLFIIELHAMILASAMHLKNLNDHQIENVVFSTSKSIYLRTKELCKANEFFCQDTVKND